MRQANALMERRATVTYGPVGNELSESCVVSEDAKLTPNLARSLAVTACGHSNGVTVRLGDIAYRLTASGARKLSDYEE